MRTRIATPATLCAASLLAAGLAGCLSGKKEGPERAQVEVNSRIHPYPPQEIFGASPGEMADADLLQTVSPDDILVADTDRERQLEMYGAPSVRGWRAANSLLALREKLKVLAPNRNKRDDGMVGDAAHASRSSDHNPWIVENGAGVVSAYDITHSPETGCDVNKLVASLLKKPVDPRLKYIIWQGHIYNHESAGGQPPWAKRKYGGVNPHNKHVHISVKSAKASYDDKSEWKVEVQ